jgi:hypothetical protein
MTSPTGGEIAIAGKRVSRLGLSTTHLVGRGARGEPTSRNAALELLRRAVHSHVITHLDSSDTYGPHVSEAPNWEAAQVSVHCPELGYSLLCNGSILFEDTDGRLPDGGVIAPHHPTPAPRTAVGVRG